MLSTKVIISLTKWIQEWKRTYRETPSLDECITWIEWKFEDSYITQSDKNLIKEVLTSNKD